MNISGINMLQLINFSVCTYFQAEERGGGVISNHFDIIILISNQTHILILNRKIEVFYLIWNRWQLYVEKKL